MILTTTAMKFAFAGSAVQKALEVCGRTEFGIVAVSKGFWLCVQLKDISSEYALHHIWSI